MKGILKSDEFKTNVLSLPPFVFLVVKQPNSQNQKANWVSHGAKTSGVLNSEPVRFWPFCLFSFYAQNKYPIRCSILGPLVWEPCG